MRTRLAAPLAPLAAGLLLSLPGTPGPDAASAQEAPTLRLTVSPQLSQQMREAPGELAWTDLRDQLSVQFTSSASLPMERVPVRVVAVAVRDGEIVGRASTTPSLATAGESIPVSRLASESWPPADDWFPAASWRPDGIASPSVAVRPEAGAAASQITLPSSAGGVMLFAAPAADALIQRFRTVPVVVTTWPIADTTRADTTPTNTDGG